MANNSLTTVDGILKRKYRDGDIAKIVFTAADRPLSTRLPKMPNYAGSAYGMSLRYGNVSAGHFSFAYAGTNMTAAAYKQWLITTKHIYTRANIENDALLAAMDKAGAFINLVKDVTDSGLSAQADMLEGYLFRDGSGKIGTIESIDGTSLTLTDPQDAKMFFLGQVLVFADDTASALKDSGASRVVSAINVATGVITATVSFATVSGLEAGDVIFQQGNYASASDANMPAGLDAWIPSTDPGATSFFNVDRSSDPIKLGGVRHDGSSDTVVGACLGGAYAIANVGPGKPDIFLVSPLSYKAAIEEVEGTVQRSQGGNAVVGADSIKVRGPKGPIEIVSAAMCPTGVGYLLESKSWELVSMGPAVQLQTSPSGAKAFEIDDVDGIQLRFVSHVNLACRAPGFNARVAIQDYTA